MSPKWAFCINGLILQSVDIVQVLGRVAAGLAGGGGESKACASNWGLNRTRLRDGLPIILEPENTYFFNVFLSLG